MPGLPTDPSELVSSFCAAWANGDADELMAYFTDDAVFHNVPMDPLEGAEAIRAFLEELLAASGGSVFETHHQAANGNVVLNERTDYVNTGAGQVVLPVCGVFEIRGGRIARWSDYFDRGQFTSTAP